MKANELRIGNFINVPCGNDEYWVRTVEEIRSDSISTENGRWCFDSSEGNEQGFYAIPITEKWLEKFGFYAYDRMGENVFFAFKFNETRNWNIGLFHGECKVAFYGLKWDKSFLIKHVHQLQNLYFAITSEELTLNP